MDESGVLASTAGFSEARAPASRLLADVDRKLDGHAATIAGIGETFGDTLGELRKELDGQGATIATIHRVLEGDLGGLRADLAKGEKTIALLHEQRRAMVSRIHDLANERDRLDRSLQQAITEGRERLMEERASLERRYDERAAMHDRALSQEREEHEDALRRERQRYAEAHQHDREGREEAVRIAEDLEVRLREAQRRTDGVRQQLTVARYDGILAPGRTAARPALITAWRRRRLLSKARSAARSGDDRSAASHYAALLALDGSRAARWKQFGHVLRSFDPDAASLAYHRALLLNPGNEDTAITLAYFLKDDGRPNEALGIAKAGLTMWPESHPLQAAVAHLEGRPLSGTAGQAGDVADSPLSFGQRLRLRAARRAARRDDQVEAGRCYRLLLANDPGNAQWMVRLGHTEKALGHLDRAERCYRDAVAMQPLNADAHLQLGWLLRQRGEEPEAADALKVAATLNPGAHQV